MNPSIVQKCERTNKPICPDTGIVITDKPKNLSLNARRIAGKWRYKTPTGIVDLSSLVTIDNPEYITTEMAFQIADELNKKFYSINAQSSVKPKLERALVYEAEQYIDWYESRNPKKAQGATWTSKNRPAIRRFAKALGHLKLSNVKLIHIHDWFDALKYHSQCNDKSAVCDFLDRLIAIEKLPQLTTNPLTARINNLKVVSGGVEHREEQEKMRACLTLDQYKMILRSAQEAGEDWFVNALLLGMLLKLRRKDIVNLRFSNLSKDGTVLHSKVTKSFNMKGDEKGTIMAFDLTDDYGVDVLRVISDANKSRNILRTNAKTKRGVIVKEAVYIESPFIIHKKPKAYTKKLPKSKACHTQLTADFLSKTFQKYRDMHPEIRQEAAQNGMLPPTFHELRSLAARLDKEKGLDDVDISVSLAHSGLDVTKSKYLHDHISQVEVAKTAVTLGDLMPT